MNATCIIMFLEKEGLISAEIPIAIVGVPLAFDVKLTTTQLEHFVRVRMPRNLLLNWLSPTK